MAYQQQQQQQQRAAPTAPMYVTSRQPDTSGAPNAIPWAALPVFSQPATGAGWIPPSRRPNIVDSNHAPQLEALYPGLMCAAQQPGVAAPVSRSFSALPPTYERGGGQYNRSWQGSPDRDAMSQSPGPERPAKRQTKKRRDFSPLADDVLEVTELQTSRGTGRKPKATRWRPAIPRSLFPDGEEASYRSRSHSPQDSARATPPFPNATPSEHTQARTARKAQPNPAHFHNGIDLNSDECKTPDFQFVDRNSYRTDIHIFRVTQPLIACLKLKECLVETFVAEGLPPRDLLRLDTQELHLLDPSQPAHMVLLVDAVHVDGNPRKPVSLAAIISKNDSHIRWFYTILSASAFLRKLEAFSCMQSRPKALEAHTQPHGSLYVLLREAFLKAVEHAHHPDHLAAHALTDYSPSISDPDTALARLEGSKDLYFSHNGKSEHLDLEHDRYLLAIEPAERFIASDLKLPCSAYLLLKRRFFQAFWRDLVACKEKIGNGRSKVRTEHAHEAWLVNEGGVKAMVGRRLVVAWRVLGLLEEKRFLPWLKAGGMVEEVWKQGDGVV
ncbi:hypothetical protein LTR78_006165 [Recurvomyces mirabilis]|uniref:Uncharacterized protein n=1 Tax=Recurvomyces mirabilis TaxID=574656 RepID=A0AAE0WLK2_9PEZI|nr:hypothetical protein LTR78_006165 [Recurvomyces mirabilis]KAK5152007.1 hypothetical protein LTS14_008781 [Recurvomyces mirabilis]